MSVGNVVQIGGAVRHTPLPSLTNLTRPSNDSGCSSKEIIKPPIGGFIGEGQLAWRAVGSSVEIVNPLTCSRQAAWTFGAILPNNSLRVTCVCGIGTSAATHVAVGVDLGLEQNPQGMVGILSLRRSRLIRTFHFRYKITNLCMITGGDKVVDSSILASELRHCKSLLAVATTHASLYLVDLGLDLGDEITSDEMSPAPLVEISIPDPQAELRRNEAIANGRHPVLCLSENMISGKTFRLLGPDESILYEMPSHDVSISYLMFAPQLASLVVGYNFGSFQIINLNLIAVDCASPFEDNLPPVFSFAYQEPENDPRSFVYLWVCRSKSACEVDNGCRGPEKSSCSLYAMNYEKKEWIEGHGLWYQGLVSVSPRFDFDALGGITEMNQSSLPSKLLLAMTVVGTTPSSSNTTPIHALTDDALTSSDEESDLVPEMSLCIFCWEVNLLDKGKISTKHYVALFDINQWYLSQMPSHLRLEANELCPYMSFHILDCVPKSMDELPLGGCYSKGSWSRHNSRSHCEKVWFPSSLSFEFNLLTSEGLATYQCPSVQQSALWTLVKQGPGAIVHPKNAFYLCIFSGILPSSESTLNEGGSSTVSEREHLLNTALEYHLLSLLNQCVMEFSEGRFVHLGCSLEQLLEWAWKQLRSIKDASSLLCLPLFTSESESCTNEPLSPQNLAALHQNLTYLSHLSTIITSIRTNAGEVTTISAGELEGRVQVVNLLHMHVQITLWFYHCGLLPQCSPEEIVDEKCVPFPAEVLHDIYKKRRKDVRTANSSVEEGDLLLIDSIMAECGGMLTEFWNREGENSQYPPPSLHSLLSMYLLPGIKTNTKHRIVQYLFLDLASLLSENYSSVLEELVKFPSSFSLSPSLIKLTQAFWLIDNKDFQAGLSVLLDPLVNPTDITLSEHRRIIRAFLYQGEEQYALSYSQVRHPPEVELEDIRLNMTVMLANGRIREAFHYQRTHRNNKELFNLLLKGCEKLGRLESIVHLPLSLAEEEVFVQYLRVSKQAVSRDILLAYYLQQTRYGELSSLSEGRLKNSNRAQNTRTALVQGYLSHLPDVSGQLIDGAKKIRSIRILYRKPQPLSAKIRQSSSSLYTPKSKAAAFRPSMHTENEEFCANRNHFTPFRSREERKRAICSWNEEESFSASQKRRPSLSPHTLSFKQLVFPSHSNEPLDEPKSLTLPLFDATSKIESLVCNRGSVRGTQVEISLLQEDISRIMERQLINSMNTSVSSAAEAKELLAVDRENLIPGSEHCTKNLTLSSDIVSLLKTTPVKQTTSAISKGSSVKHSLVETPQSILKVRKILQQSLHTSDIDSPYTFPLHRSAMKMGRGESIERADTTCTSEASSFTAKHLRFDLSSHRRISTDTVPESQKDNFVVDEENERECHPSAAGRKRKREESPPQSSLKKIISVPDTPTPRKPLPRYSPTELDEVLSDDLRMRESELQEKSELSNYSTKNRLLSSPTSSAVNPVSKTAESRLDEFLTKFDSLETELDVTRETSYKFDNDDELENCDVQYSAPNEIKTVSMEATARTMYSSPLLEENTICPISHLPAFSTFSHHDSHVSCLKFLENSVIINNEDKTLCKNNTVHKGLEYLVDETDYFKEVPSVAKLYKEAKAIEAVEEDSIQLEEENGDTDLESSYFLKFSDSEEENKNVKSLDNSLITSCVASTPELSNQEKISLDPAGSETVSKQDTIILNPLVNFLHEEIIPQSKILDIKNVQVSREVKVAPMVAVPSDLVNVSTSTEKETVDSVLTGTDSLSLKNYQNKDSKEINVHTHIPLSEVTEFVQVDKFSSGFTPKSGSTTTPLKKTQVQCADTPRRRSARIRKRIESHNNVEEATSVPISSSTPLKSTPSKKKLDSSTTLRARKKDSLHLHASDSAFEIMHESSDASNIIESNNSTPNSLRLHSLKSGVLKSTPHLSRDFHSSSPLHRSNKTSDNLNRDSRHVYSVTDNAGMGGSASLNNSNALVIECFDTFENAIPTKKVDITSHELTEVITENDVDSSNILKFSDSEEENTKSFDTAAKFVSTSNVTSMLEPFGKQEKIALQPAVSEITKKETTLSSPLINSLHEEIKFQAGTSDIQNHEFSNKVEFCTVDSVPSDVVSVNPLLLASTEREVANPVMKESTSLSLKNSLEVNSKDGNVSTHVPASEVIQDAQLDKFSRDVTASSFTPSDRTPGNQADTPRRTLARVSRRVGRPNLETVEEFNSECISATPSPNKSTPISASQKFTSNKNSKSTLTSRRNSSQALPTIEPILETIREDSELLYNSWNNGTSFPVPCTYASSDGMANTSLALLPLNAPTTPLRRSRRRSSQVFGDNKENGATDSLFDDLPIARRTRRSSASSNISENSNDRYCSNSVNEESTKAANGGSTSLNADNIPLANYAFISPEDAPDISSQKASQLLPSVSVLSTHQKHSSLPWRKSMQSLSVPIGFDFMPDGISEDKRTKYAGRKSTRDFSKSVLVIKKKTCINNATEFVNFDLKSENAENSPFTDDVAQDVSTNYDLSMPIHNTPYHRLEGTESIDMHLGIAERMTMVKRHSQNRCTSSFRKGVTSMKIIGSFNEDETNLNRNPRKLKRTKKEEAEFMSDEHVFIVSKKKDNDGYVFQNPEEVLSTTEAVSEVFQRLTEEHERMVLENFVFSPPLSLSSRKKKRNKRDLKK